MKYFERKKHLWKKVRIERFLDEEQSKLSHIIKANQG